MTAYVDFRFTEATGWTDSANALSIKASGAASSGSISSGSDTPTLILSGPSVPAISGVEDATITGVRFEIWPAQNGSGTTTNPFDTVQFDCAIGTSSNLAAGVNFGVRNPLSTTAAREPVYFGGESNLWGFPALTLSQFTTGFELSIVATVVGPKARNFTVWDTKGRLWLDALSMEDVTKRAFRKIGVLSIDEDLDADSLAHGVDLLNDMMFGWAMFGVAYNHVEKAAGEAFPIARKFVEGTSMMLAARLSQDYQVPPVASDRFFASLSRAYNVENEADYRDDDGDGVVSEAEIDQDKVSRFF